MSGFSEENRRPSRTRRPAVAPGGAPEAARGRERKGFSLVEILVVLVVLILGMLAIARLFPGGFASLGFSANAAAGGSADRGMLNYAKAHQDTLPDVIIGLNHDPNRWSNGDYYWWDFPVNQNLTALPFVVPGFNGTQPDDPRFSDINYQRRVLGERFTIPPPTTTNTPANEAACLYNVLFAPIYTAQPMYPYSAPQMPTVALGVSAYSGTPMRRIAFTFPPPPFTLTDSGSPWFALNSSADFGYGIDYGNPVAGSTPPPGSTTRNPTLYLLSEPVDRVFRVNFSYHLANGAAGQAPAENWLLVPASNAAGQELAIDLSTASATAGLPYSGIPAGSTLDQGSELIFRRFVQLPVGTSFSGTNPYEFKVYDTVTGLFGFNPLASSLTIPQQQGRGLAVKVDYDVDDWHILHQDETVSFDPVDPNANLYAVRLASNGIKKVGDTEDTLNFVNGQPADDNTFLYQGLIRYYPDTPARPGTPGVDLIVLDLQTGLVLDNSTLAVGGGPNGSIDYNNGVLDLRGTLALKSPVTGGAITSVSAPGRHLRIMYRTYTELGASLQKASSQYYLVPGLSLVQQRQYTASYGAGYLLFPMTDVGKSVAVDYTYVRQIQSGGSSVQKTYPVMGEIHQIQPPDSPTANVFGPQVAASLGQAWVRLTHADPDPNNSASNGNADPAVVPGSIQVTTVRGSSLHAWAAWRDAGTWRQRYQSTLQSQDDVRQ